MKYAPAFAAEQVRAALRDDAHDAARRAAEFRRITGRLDLHLLDEVGEERRRGDAGPEVRRVDAIEVELVLGGGRAVDRDPAASALLVRAGRQRDERREITSLRQLVDCVGAKVRRGGRLLDVDRRRFGRDLHVLCKARHGERQIHLQELADLDDDRGARRGIESLKIGGDFITTRIQRRKAIGAAFVGHRRECAGLALGFDSHPGKNSARGVFDDSFDRSARFLGRSRPGAQQGSEK